MSDRIKDKTAAERALTEYAYEHGFKAITTSAARKPLPLGMGRKRRSHT